MSNASDKQNQQIKNLKNHKISTKNKDTAAEYFGKPQLQGYNNASKEFNLKRYKSLSMQTLSNSFASNGYSAYAEPNQADGIDYSILPPTLAKETSVQFYEGVSRLTRNTADHFSSSERNLKRQKRTQRKGSTFQQEFHQAYQNTEDAKSAKKRHPHTEQSRMKGRSSQSLEIGNEDCEQLNIKQLKTENVEYKYLESQIADNEEKNTYSVEQSESSSGTTSRSEHDYDPEDNCSEDDAQVKHITCTVSDMDNWKQISDSLADFEMKHENKQHSQLPPYMPEEGSHQQSNLFNSLNFHNTLMNSNSYRECKNEICRLQTAREHFHCYDFACLGKKVLIRQKDLLRHIKWHRRQNKSLAHGFLRYSVGDECDGSEAAGISAGGAAADSCQYRRRQTHYHCVQGNCARVCVNLGAAKMHANDHKIAAMTTATEHRDFQRYHSNEDCSADFCIFFGTKIAHFHCSRENCQYTTKAQTDMETHKAYHLSESMQYARAADSRQPERSEACAVAVAVAVAADIPQPREARRQSEQQQQQQCRQHEQCRFAVRADNYDKLLSRCGSERTSMDARGSELESLSSDGKELRRGAALDAYETGATATATAATTRTTSVADKHKMRRHSDSESECYNNSSSSRSSSRSSSSNVAASRAEPACSTKTTHLATMEYLQKMLQQQQQLLLLQKQHELLLLQQQQQSNKEAKTFITAEESQQNVRTTAVRTAAAAAATTTATITRASATAATTTPVNDDVSAVVGTANHSGLSAAAAATFYQQLANAAAAAAVDMSAVADVSAALKSAAHPVQITSIDGFFNRKRGRPPKNRFVEVYKNTQQSPQAIFTSFKLEKHGLGNAELLENISKVDATSEREHLVHTPRDKYQQQLLQALAKEHIKATSACSPTLEQQSTLFPFQPMRKETQETQHSAATVASFPATATLSSTIQASYSNKGKIESTASNSHLPLTSEAFNLIRYDQFIEDEFDCRIERCRLRRIHPHLHCKNCKQLVSPLDLKSHACAESLVVRNTRQHTAPTPTNEFGEATTAVSRAEKVSVVRAAGTFYPENSSSNNDATKLATSTSEESKSPNNNGATVTATKSVISLPTCKAKRRRTEAPVIEVAHKTVQPAAQRQRQYFPASATTAFVAREEGAHDADMPQDLSVHAATAAATVDAAAATTAAAEYKQQQEQLSMHFQQLISLYQQQQQQQQMLYGTTGMPTYALPTLVPQQQLSEVSPMFTGAGASPLNMVASLFETFSNAASRQHPLLSMATASAIAAAATNTHTQSESDLLTVNKNRTSTAAGLLHKLKDDRIPTGYLKFRFNEDCGFPKCGYRNHQSHFHCNRIDCHYSFCDKTRFVQHTARHERLDTLMGDDFLQYRANMNCGYDNCLYLRTDASTSEAGTTTKKSSHFHCRKCEFICSDTNKVVAHRRLHNKMEYIRLAGFRKVACNENCKQLKRAMREQEIASRQAGNIDSIAENHEMGNRQDVMDMCPYSMKHTHYHCLVCDCSVLSRAQLATHKHKMPPTATMPAAKTSATATTSV